MWVPKFIRDEDGAVTVDWVVLTASIVGLGAATFAAVGGGIENASDDTSSTMSDFSISTAFGASGGVALAAWTAIGLSPDGVEANRAWMANFTDEQLLAHMNNQEQYSDVAPGAGHPTATYHDEYYIARDEANSRGLL